MYTPRPPTQIFLKFWNPYLFLWQIRLFDKIWPGEILGLSMRTLYRFLRWSYRFGVFIRNMYFYMDNNFVIHYEFIRLTTKQLFANNHFLTKWPKPDFAVFLNITRLYYAGQEKWLRILKLHAILRVFCLFRNQKSVTSYRPTFHLKKVRSKCNKTNFVMHPFSTFEFQVWCLHKKYVFLHGQQLCNTLWVHTTNHEIVIRQ